MNAAKFLLVVLITSGIFFNGAFAAAAFSPTSAKRKRERVIFAPKPEYGKDWPEGPGLFLMHIGQKTGDVISVDVLESTGHKLLDESAVTAFQHWRFKPHSASKAKVPITFSHHLDPDKFKIRR